MIRTAALVTLALASPAGAFDLVFPVDCTLGATCYIQQYPDHDPGPDAADYTCGPLSYDGHDGTDIALATRADMAAGVTVWAAAPGIVKGVRDGVADFEPAIAGKECGNGVVVDHGQGWETQYCHLKQGSVRVQTGDRVDAKTALGQIGQSGQAAFPHLHLSVRQDGRKLDPFAPDAKACGAAGGDLWAQDLPHEPGGLLGVGITDHVPEFEAIKAGLPSHALPDTAPALVIWAYGFGFQAGDAVVFSLTGPDGEVVRERVQIEKTQALVFRAVGRKRGADAWPAGVYRGSATLIRDRETLDAQELSITLAP